MKAEPGRQLALLDLQALDTRVRQLQHQREHLPVLEQIADLDNKAALIDSEIVTKTTELADVRRELTKAEAAVQQVRDRATRDTERLNAGTGMTSKDLVSLQSELESLARHQAKLEDEELEVMERVETLEHDATALTTGREELATRLTDLMAQRDRELADIDAELASVSAPRDDLVNAVGPELVALYEKIVQTQGTGAAAIQQRRCLGCQLELNSTDLTRIRDADEDEVLRCDECRRILVRTPESGL